MTERSGTLTLSPSETPEEAVRGTLAAAASLLRTYADDGEALASRRVFRPGSRNHREMTQRVAVLREAADIVAGIEVVAP